MTKALRIIYSYEILFQKLSKAYSLSQFLDFLNYMIRGLTDEFMKTKLFAKSKILCYKVSLSHWYLP